LPARKAEEWPAAQRINASEFGTLWIQLALNHYLVILQVLPRYFGEAKVLYTLHHKTERLRYGMLMKESWPKSLKGMLIGLILLHWVQTMFFVLDALIISVRTLTDLKTCKSMRLSAMRKLRIQRVSV
jgi:hypothetical protein